MVCFGATHHRFYPTLLNTALLFTVLFFTALCMIIGFVGEDLVFVKGVQGLQARNYPAILATPQVRCVSVYLDVPSQLSTSYI